MEPHAPGMLPPTHTLLVEQQVPPPQFPLVGCRPQVEVQAPPLQVGVPLAQARHATPVDPQLPLLVPATQMPPPQQPPLQAV